MREGDGAGARGVMTRGRQRVSIRAMPIEIVPYDAGWATRFQVEAARIQSALGDAALSIEHIGSTSVVGLAAKDIVDIQVAVASFDPEASYRGPLERLGYVFRADDEPAHRFFKLSGSDGRPLVHIHVCQTGSVWEAQHLAFRDRLRSSASAAAAYEQLKRQLAPQFENGNDYADAKGDFIRELQRRGTA